MSKGLDCMLGRRCDSVTLHTCNAVPEVPSIPGTLNISPDIQGEDDGTSLVPVERYLAVRQGEKPLGVYALYDSRRNLQYVGYARNMTMAIKVPLAMQGVLPGKLLSKRADSFCQSSAWLVSAHVHMPLATWQTAHALACRGPVLAGPMSAACLCLHLSDTLTGLPCLRIPPVQLLILAIRARRSRYENRTPSSSTLP